MESNTEEHPWVAYVLGQIKSAETEAAGEYRRPEPADEDINEQREQIMSEQQNGNTSRSSEFFRVLPGMRHANESEYDPTIFSFGPYHTTLGLPMPLGNHYKIQAAKALTSLHSFRQLADKIGQQDTLIRSLYTDPGWDESDGASRAHLLALDALMLVGAPSLLKETTGLPRMLFWIASRDALLLENQIPLFVLQHAIDSITKPVLQLPHLTRDVLRMHLIRCGYPFQSHLDKLPHDIANCLHHSMLTYIYHTLILGNSVDADKHALEIAHEVPASVERLSMRRQHLLLEYFQSTSAATIFQGAVANPEVMAQLGDYDSVQQHEPIILQVLPACALRRRGITIVGMRDRGFQGMSYEDRVLTLPELTMYGNTKSLLLNLLAYEATSGAEGQSPVKSYVVLMNDLLQSEEDVQVLVDCGAIVLRNMASEYSNAQFASMWKTLTHKLPFPTTDKLVQISTNVNRDCERKRYQWSAAACRYRVQNWSAAFVDRFWEKQPWLLLSIITALFLLVLTILQTIYAVLQYHLDRRRSN